MRFLALGLEHPVPDATAIWLFREQLTRAGAIEDLFGTFDAHLKGQGYLAMSGQIVDASITPPHASGTQMSRNVLSRRAAFLMNGRQTRRSWRKRIGMPAGPSSEPKPDRLVRTQANHASRSPFRCLATRTT